MKKVLIVAGLVTLTMAIPMPAIAQEGESSVPESQESPSLETPTAPALPEVTGIYLAQGVSFAGEPYQQFLEVSHYNEAYRLIWKTNKGGITAEGIGILENDVLSVGIHSPESMGVVVYRFDFEASQWLGTWTDSGNGMLSREVLNKLEELPPKDETSEPEEVVPPRPAKSPLSPGVRVA